MVTIGNRKIGPNHPPLIVAEMSANHQGSLKRALQIVDAAKAAGAHAIKLQTYTADTMTLDKSEGEFTITDPDSLWHGKTLYTLYKETYTPWEWHKEIQDRCKKHGLIFFSTPFDETAVDFLEDLKVPCYKIASFEIVDLNLIRKVAKTGKPVILSTGGATYEEINDAVQAAREEGCNDLVLLKCTASYPASPVHSNLRTIPNLAKSFDVLVGLSDHTLGIGAAIASIPLGVCLIEKHFTISRADGSEDAAFSLEPHEMEALVKESQSAWQALGEVHYGPTEAERSPLVLFRRSLYFVKDLKAGTRVATSDVRAIRPGRGLPPKELDNIIGLKITRNVRKGEPVSWELLEQE